ncbi:TIGR00725 family protein [Plantactinospora siamensis]|uniref:TIGR00725 family protein n=1 Tax=Plantactinospora siamensis TaxID=555372 RepID=A0ABV6P261_9ACTN
MTDGRRRQIAVCGPAECAEREARYATEVGRLLAEAGAVVVCGGGGGVMAAVAAGARSAGGLVLGVLPEADRRAAGPDLSAALATGMGQARNVIVAASGDAVIVIGGSWGTLSELAHAYRLGVPVVCLGGWGIVDSAGRPVDLTIAPDPAAAVRLALELASHRA